MLVRNGTAKKTELALTTSTNRSCNLPFCF